VQIAILEPTNFSPEALAALKALGTVVLVEDANKTDALKGAEVLFVRLGTMIDAAFLRSAPCLKFVCSPTTGHTHLDSEALSSRGIQVLSLRGETAFLETIRATPEHTLGLMLALIRQYRSAMVTPSNLHWDRDRCRGEELFGMPVGIIGYGRVGSRLATYLDVLGAQVGYHDIREVKAVDGHRRFQSVDALIEHSRMVVMAASYVEGAPPVLAREQFLAMQGRYFINTARGELVDEEALLELLNSGHFAGCAIDVIAQETGASRRDQWFSTSARADLILTPHIAGATVASMAATENFIVEKLRQCVASSRMAI
jgi:D-3-phosphoglycerate dehydrogenase / 2-oxoglutarate reductase